MVLPSENPYQTPAADLPERAAAGLATGGPLAPWQRVLRNWELLRIPYNLLVGLTGIASVLPQAGKLLHPGPLIGLVFYALGANFCFFIGPAIELYLAWIGVRNQRVRWVLFAVGTLLAMALTWQLGVHEGLAMLAGL